MEVDYVEIPLPVDMIEAAREAGRLAGREWTESRGLFVEFIDDRLVHAITDASLAAALSAGETRTEWRVVWDTQVGIQRVTVVWASLLDTLAEAQSYYTEAQHRPGARIEARTVTEIDGYKITSPWVEVPNA